MSYHPASARECLLLLWLSEQTTTSRRSSVTSVHDQEKKAHSEGLRLVFSLLRQDFSLLFHLFFGDSTKENDRHDQMDENVSHLMACNWMRLIHSINSALGIVSLAELEERMRWVSRKALEFVCKFAWYKTSWDFFTASRRLHISLYLRHLVQRITLQSMQLHSNTLLHATLSADSSFNASYLIENCTIVNAQSVDAILSWFTHRSASLL